MPLDLCPPKVIIQKDIKHSVSITIGDKAQITTLVCCSAAGYVLTKKTEIRNDSW